jgi:hypothetical protein
MSYQKFIDLICDLCNKHNSFAMAQTTTKSRELAKKEGWKYKNGKDYCNKCADNKIV